MRRYILLYIRGGLGNQLFQISAARAVTKKNDRILVLTYSVNSDLNASRHLNMKESTIKYLIGDDRSCTLVESQFGNKFLYKSINFLEKFRFFNKLVINDSNINSLIKNEKYGFYILKGWFQSNQLVDLSYKKELPNLQRLIESENIDLKLIAMSQKAANIHLRLGDFIQNGLPIPSKEYYGKNYDAVKKSFSSILVNLYSDDIEAAKEYLSDLDLQFPELQRPLNSFELLMVLSNSKVFIASTSTLAWWASKLGKDAGNLVYHPFGGALDL